MRHRGQVHTELPLQGHQALVDELLRGLQGHLRGEGIQHGGPGVVGDGLQLGGGVRDQLLQDGVLVDITKMILKNQFKNNKNGLKS